MASVTFSSLTGGDGSTITDDSDPVTGLDGGGHIYRFVPALAQTVLQAQSAVQSAASAQAAAVASQTAKALAEQAKAGALAISLNVPTGLPTVKPAALFDFANSRSVDPRITFSRASVELYCDRTGVWRTAAVNEPAIHYDPVTHQCLGLSAFGGNTNVVLWNRDLTNAAWTKSNCTAALTQTGIDGAANAASLLTATAANATCLQAITLTSSARFQSAFIKRSAGAGAISMTMDGGATWVPVTVNTTSFTRVSIPTQTLANPSVGFKLAVLGDAIVVDYVQNEDSTFATPPILTTTAAVARSAVTITATGTNFSSWFNPTEGTIVAGFALASPASPALSNLVRIDDGTDTNRLMLRCASSQVLLQSITSNTLDCSLTGRTINAFDNVLAAFRYRANDYALSINADAILSDTAVVVPSVNQLRVAAGAIGYPNGYLAHLTYYQSGVTDAELQALSTL